MTRGSDSALGRTRWPPPASFWSDAFMHFTEGGIRPYLFKRLLPDNVCSEARVLEAIRRLQSSDFRQAVSTRVRIYLDEAREDDLAARAVSEAVMPDETILGFLQRITGVERVGLVINNFEQCSPFFASEMHSFLSSLFDVHGAPIGGAEQVVFAGNYSGTAFGVHEGYEHAFLTHLGPGTKLFYCWSQEQYVKYTGGSRAPTFGDYQEMLKTAELFVMEPGDALYLPALVYHVGRQTDFSISIALPMYTYPIKRFIARVILPVAAHMVPFDTEGMSRPIQTTASSDELFGVVSADLNDLFVGGDSSPVRCALDCWWNALQSNGFWDITDRFGRSLMSDSEVETMHLGLPAMSTDFAWKIKRPYTIVWQKGLNCADEHLRIFCAGTDFVAAANSSVFDLIQKLNSGISVKTKDVNKHQLHVLSRLAVTGGIESCGSGAEIL